MPYTPPATTATTDTMSDLNNLFHQNGTGLNPEDKDIESESDNEGSKSGNEIESENLLATDAQDNTNNANSPTNRGLKLAKNLALIATIALVTLAVLGIFVVPGLFPAVGALVLASVGTYFAYNLLEVYFSKGDRSNWANVLASPAIGFAFGTIINLLLPGLGLPFYVLAAAGAVLGLVSSVAVDKFTPDVVEEEPVKYYKEPDSSRVNGSNNPYGHGSLFKPSAQTTPLNSNTNDSTLSGGKGASITSSITLASNSKSTTPTPTPFSCEYKPGSL